MLAEETGDFSLKITAISLKIIGVWTARNKAEKRRRTFGFVSTMIFILNSVQAEVTDFVYQWRRNDLERILHVLCFLVATILVITKIVVLYLNRVNIHKMISFMEEHFWHTDYDLQELQILEECKHRSSYYIGFFNTVCFITTFFYITLPLVETYSGEIRKFPLDPHNDALLVSYKYEITYFTQACTFLISAFYYICVDNFICVANFQSSTQFRILQYKLANIVKQINKEKYCGSLETVPGYIADNSYATFKKCVEHHQRLLDYCDKVQTIFSLVGLVQVMSFSMLLCIGGYLLMVDGAEFFNRVLYLMHTIGCTSQLFTFSYSCDCVMRESEAVCQAAYDIQWTILPYNESGKILRRDLQMVVVRAREPCYVTAGGFFPVCLETFSKVISTAVSYFTLLRQY